MEILFRVCRGLHVSPRFTFKQLRSSIVRDYEISRSIPLKENVWLDTNRITLQFPIAWLEACIHIPGNVSQLNCARVWEESNSTRSEIEFHRYRISNTDIRAPVCSVDKGYRYGNSVGKFLVTVFGRSATGPNRTIYLQTVKFEIELSKFVVSFQSYSFLTIVLFSNALWDKY